MTIQQLIAELEERDPDAPVTVTGDGEIIDIFYEDNGTITLMGEYEV